MGSVELTCTRGIECGFELGLAALDGLEDYFWAFDATNGDLSRGRDLKGLTLTGR